MFLNFGRFFGFGFQSKFDTLLKQDNLTLEIILNEEDILAELKNSSSGKFADFIIQNPQEYVKMIHYIINNVNDQEYDKNLYIKYPFLISEILGSENEKLINFLFEKQGDISQEEVQNPLEDQPTESQPQEFQHENEKLRQNLLPDLLSLLENDSLLITQAGYFTKIISAIIHKRGYDFWEYLKSNPGIITNLFKHASIRHITEIFEKLIILDTCQEEHDDKLHIEERQNLIIRILKYMKGQSHSNTIITNICESLIEVYKRVLMSLESMVVQREILLTIEKPQFFMNLAIQTQNSSLFNLLNIQYEFYNKMSQLEDKHYEIEFSVLYKPILDESVKALTQQDLFRASFLTTYGDTIKPLGDSKLSLIQLIIQLIQKQQLAIIIEKGQIFQQIINLVIDYQTNNQLHILFEKLIVAILDSKNDHLHELFFEDTNFLNFIIKNNGSEERKKKHGYQGVLTKITNYINSPNVSQQYQIVQTAIASIQNEWLKYLEELKVVNEIEQSWLLGVNPRFREQINVDSYSPPLQWPDPIGSDQYKSNQQTNENQQESQEDTSKNNENEENNQQTDEFDKQEAQLEKQLPEEVVQVKEENIESQEEQQPQKYEQQIVDSPVYVQNIQNEEQNIEQIKEFQEEPKQQVQEEIEIDQVEVQITEQKQEQQNILQEQPQQEEQQILEEQPQQDEQQILEEQPKQEEQQILDEQPKQEQQQQILDEQPKQEEQQQILDEKPKQEQQQILEEQPKQEEQQNLLQEEPKQEEQQQAQVEQEPQAKDHQNSEQQKQNKQPQDEV